MFFLRYWFLKRKNNKRNYNKKVRNFMKIVHKKITINELQKMSQTCGNRTRGMNNLEIQKRIINIVNKLVVK